MRWTSIRLLSFSINCVTLRKPWSFPSIIWCIPTLAEILKLSRIRLPCTRLLPRGVATLRLLMIDSSIWLIMVSASTYLVRTAPLFSRDAHPVYTTSTSAVTEWLTLSADVLWLSLANNSHTQGLWHIIRWHWWILLDISMPIIDLINIVMATLPHLILLYCHIVLVLLMASSFLLLSGHMLIEIIAHHVILMHCE